MPKPLVALVGRPNVGKSTIFNRIIGERVAIVEDVAGTTRDRLYYDAEWAGKEFTIIDTGGLEVVPGSDLANRVREQAQAAMAEADVILFVVDVRDGVTTGDLEVAKLLRQTTKPVIVVVNKADSMAQNFNATEFYRLGLANVYSISALHGTGTGDLLDAIVNGFPKLPPSETEAQEEETGIRLALVGRPNVGKSSLLNALVGAERVIVSEIPGTTRDAIDIEMQVRGANLVIVDTAGVRRRGRIEQGIEKYSVLRSIRAIERASVVAVLIDASEGVTAQDTHLAGFAASEAKGLVFVVNKWDLVPQTNDVRDGFIAQIRSEMRFAPYAPILFVSATQRWHLDEFIATILQIDEVRHRRISTATLNGVIIEAVAAHGPSHDRGRTFKIYYVTQSSVNPPTFVFFVNDPDLLHFSYRRYLENRLRQAFGFEGTAIRMFFRSRTTEQAERTTLRAR
ncbi:MAG: ribosome biogenesis GTPase Der [Thermomicrobiales bacterium]|nr:ribosome biogenesis GTPase Der [Thermomicrobiales bacterium]